MTCLAFLWPFHPGAPTAAAVRLLSFVRAANDLGTRAVVVVPVSEGFGNTPKVAAEILELPLYDSAAISVGMWGAILSLPYSTIGLIKALHVARPDCVVASTPTPFLPFQGLVSSKVLGLPYVLDIRDSWEIEKATHRGRVRNFAKEWMERTCAVYADIVFTVTPTLADEVTKRYRLSKAKVRVVANGADLEMFQPGLIRDIDLIFVGSPAAYRDIPGVLEAVARISRLRPGTSAQFIGWGDTPQTNSILSQAKRLGVPPSVEFLPTTPHSQVSSSIRRARLGIVSLSNDHRFRAAVGAKTYEYVACAVPLACLGPTGDSELRRLVESRSLGFYATNPKDFAEQATSLLGDQERWQVLSRNCATASREFDRLEIARLAIHDTIVPLAMARTRR